MEAMKNNGLESSYFKHLLRGTSSNYDLVPFDCRYIPSTIFTDSQLLLWDARWRRAFTQLRNGYAGGPHAALTLAQLAGDEPYDKPKDQSAELPRDVIADIKEAA